MGFLANREYLPDFFSVLPGSLLMAAGIFYLYKGFLLFLQIKSTPKHIYVLLGLYVVLQVFFLFIFPDFAIRNILFSGLMVFFSGQMAWMCFKQVKPEIRKFTSILGFVTSVFGVVALIRIIVNIFIIPAADSLHAVSYEAVMYLIFQMMYIILTITLFMMVNRRLMDDLETDIRKREEAETELQLSQEKFAIAFHASPDSILITRISDGKIIDINDSFQRITGYSRDDVLGKSTLEIQFWNHPEDRLEFVRELQENNYIRNAQYNFRVKSGKVIRATTSSEYIKLGDDECVLSVVHDITDKRRMEDILNLRLKLWDYSLSHSAREVMVKTLDEIEGITGSQISFYHLVNEDSNSLALQAWSSRTTNTFCRAEGSGEHYSIDMAGVWVDCIRERKTIIHNNYQGLGHKHGMPEGHASLIRELLVPVFQHDQIVSILGLGNKPTDYDQNDADFVENMAVLVWPIVSKKWADEKILDLNHQLANLALTDELTGLPNRRAFFQRGSEEISRSKRYQTPVSMLMLDIDRFKDINDTYGHTRGDDALQTVARILHNQLRDVDLPARLGGEEFGVLLPNTGLEEARMTAERIRGSLAKTRFGDTGEESIAVTVSLGVAEFGGSMKNLDDLFTSSDTAMYKAKNNGRNRVEVFRPDTGPVI